MTLNDIKSMLESTGYPTAYKQFKVPPTIPFIGFCETGTTIMSADDIIYKKIISYRVELYTNEKDKVAEQKLENILENNRIIYDKDEVYIFDEKINEIIYEFEEME